MNSELLEKVRNSKQPVENTFSTGCDIWSEGKLLFLRGIGILLVFFHGCTVGKAPGGASGDEGEAGICLREEVVLMLGLILL